MEEYLYDRNPQFGNQGWKVKLSRALLYSLVMEQLVGHLSGN